MRDLPADWNVITAPFGDRDYPFRLGWDQLVELEHVREAGAMQVLTRLSGPWAMMDIREVLRLALIGGGLNPTKALKLVRLYCEQRPALENLDLSFRVLATAINGPPLSTINGEVPSEPPSGN